jgi:hypothetical protein
VSSEVRELMVKCNYKPSRFRMAGITGSRKFWANDMLLQVHMKINVELFRSAIMGNSVKIRNDHYANIPYLKTAVSNNFMSRTMPKETAMEMSSSMSLQTEKYKPPTEKIRTIHKPKKIQTEIYIHKRHIQYGKNTIQTQDPKGPNRRPKKYKPANIQTADYKPTDLCRRQKMTEPHRKNIQAETTEPLTTQKPKRPNRRLQFMTEKNTNRRNDRNQNDQTADRKNTNKHTQEPKQPNRRPKKYKPPTEKKYPKKVPST